MSALAKRLIEQAIAVVTELILPRLVSSEQAQALRHLERRAGELAANVEAQIERDRRARAVGKNR